MHTFVSEKIINPLCPGLAKEESVAHIAPNSISSLLCTDHCWISKEPWKFGAHVTPFTQKCCFSYFCCFYDTAQKETWNKDVFALLYYLPSPGAASSHSLGRNLDLPLSERCCECRWDKLRGWPAASGSSRKQELAREKKGDDKWGTREEQTWRQCSMRDLYFELVLPTWPPRFTETRLGRDLPDRVWCL